MINFLDKQHEILYFVEMSKGDSLGEFEYLLLLAILRLNPNAYGMTVRREIAERTNREVTIGAVYATLERLENKGLVKSHDQVPSAEEGGRTKRIYKVTAIGMQAVKSTSSAMANMMDGLNLAKGQA